jgi:hypothetical protein
MEKRRLTWISGSRAVRIKGGMRWLRFMSSDGLLYQWCWNFGFCYHNLSYLVNWLTLWSRVYFEKLIVTQPVKKLPVFYATRMFITVFTTARHWSLFWARWIQSTISHPITLRLILILSFHLCLYLPSGLFPSDFHTKVCMQFSSLTIKIHSLSISSSLIWSL